MVEGPLVATLKQQAASKAKAKAQSGELHQDMPAELEEEFARRPSTLVGADEVRLASGRLSRPMFIKSSTVLELEAMHYTLVSLHRVLCWSQTARLGIIPSQKEGR